MTERQTIYPTLAPGMIGAFADQPVLLDGMKVEFDEKVGLYPARVELTEDGDGGAAPSRGNGHVRPLAAPGAATLRSRIDGR